MRFKQIRNRISNQRGEALVLALALTLLGLISSLAIMGYSRNVEANSKLPRIKSMMTSLEAKVRAALLKPSTYNCPSGRSSCKLITDLVTSLGRNIPSAQCPSNATCGLKVSVVNFQNSLSVNGQTVTRTKVKIHYEGLDANLRDLDFDVDAPADLLQHEGTYFCPQDKPKFNGFLANGQMDCSALPQNVLPGHFVNVIDPYTVTMASSSLPSSAACSSNELIGEVDWGNGGNSFKYTCVSRLDPITTFGFLPKAAPAGDVTYTRNPDY